MDNLDIYINSENKELREFRENLNRPVWETKGPERITLNEFVDILYNYKSYDNSFNNSNDLFWPLINYFLIDLCWHAASELRAKKEDIYKVFLILLISSFIDLNRIEELPRLDESEELSNLYHSAVNELKKAIEVLLELSDSLLDDGITIVQQEAGFHFKVADSSLVEKYIYQVNWLSGYLSYKPAYGWSGLSSGESAKLKLFSRLYSGIGKLRSSSLNHYLIIMDEVDLYLHPEWQRRIYSELLAFSKQVLKIAESIQFITSSHSPIIASDFLPCDITQITKIDNDITIKPARFGFGTTIAQLYFDSFMLESSIGAHSRQKLDMLLENFRSRNLSESDINLIEMIGNSSVRAALMEESSD